LLQVIVTGVSVQVPGKKVWRAFGPLASCDIGKCRAPLGQITMWLPIIGLLVGIAIGSIFSVTIPAQYSRYTAIAILAASDSILGAARAQLEGQYDNRVFMSGFCANALLAGFLTFVGDRLGVELYYAAIVAFGVRLFNNLAIIRRHFL
jgi:small basic protein